MDREAINGMIKSGIPVNAIFMARQEQTPETITSLILAAAPHYPLKDILALYPHKTGKIEAGVAEKTAEISPGENAFFEVCERNLQLYSDFFYALTHLHYDVDGPLYNPLDPDQLHYCITDEIKVIYTPTSLAKIEAQYVKHTQIQTLFRTFQISFEDAVNLDYLKRLLDISFPATKLSLAKKNPQRSRQIQKIRAYGPFLRGEISLQVDRDLSKAWECFSKIKNMPAGDINDLLRIHMAEVQLGTYTNTMHLDHKLLNEKEGVKQLMGLKDHPIALLRLAEYYLGFFGHQVDEKRGLETIAKAAHHDQVSHMAYRVWAEYYLGLTNGPAYNINRAKELLDLAFQKCDGIQALEAGVQLRLGEIALGIFENGEESTPTVNPLPAKNIPLAIKMFETIKPDADIFLHRIYTGYYGAEFAESEAAQRVWNRMVAENSEFVQIKLAIEEYNKGNIAEAVKVFKCYSTLLIGAYALGCIKSNPSHPEFYTPNEAFAHFEYLYPYNFRDSRVRLCKLLFQNTGVSVLPGHEVKAIQWILKSYRKDTTKFTVDKFLAQGIPLRREITTADTTPLATQELLKVFSESPSPVVTSVAPEHEDESESAPITPEEAATEAFALAEEMEALDEKAPIRVLTDERLQDLYDGLGSCPRWRRLQEVVMAFGGEIDLKAQTMKLPHTEKVFNFHRPHSGNPPISLQGYWVHLKHMLDHEFDVHCQMEQGKKSSI